MKQIKIGKALTVIGNVNRIAEMVDHAGDNAIAGHFQDQGVNISPEFVRAIRTEMDEFSKKAVSKESTSKVIQSIQRDKATQENISTQPSSI